MKCGKGPHLVLPVLHDLAVGLGILLGRLLHLDAVDLDAEQGRMESLIEGEGVPILHLLALPAVRLVSLGQLAHLYTGDGHTSGTLHLCVGMQATALTAEAFVQPLCICWNGTGGSPATPPDTRTCRLQQQKWVLSMRPPPRTVRTFGALVSTRVLPRARLCSVRRSSPSSMPEASLRSKNPRRSTSLNSMSTTVCTAASTTQQGTVLLDFSMPHGGFLCNEE